MSWLLSKEWLPWLVGGMLVGMLLFLPVFFYLLRRMLQTEQVVLVTIEQLARHDKDLEMYKTAYEKTWYDAEDLRTEKLHKWGIPDEL